MASKKPKKFSIWSDPDPGTGFPKNKPLKSLGLLSSTKSKNKPLKSLGLLSSTKSKNKKTPNMLDRQKHGMPGEDEHQSTGMGLVKGLLGNTDKKATRDGHETRERKTLFQRWKERRKAKKDKAAKGSARADPAMPDDKPMAQTPIKGRILKAGMEPLRNGGFIVKVTVKVDDAKKASEMLQSFLGSIQSDKEPHK